MNGPWSGAVTHAPAGETFEWVFGQWNAPHVDEPRGGGAGSWWAATWIGIDGVIEVTQIGTMQVVTSAADGSVTGCCFAWHEWWPEPVSSPWVAIPNFPVDFGDTVCGLICMQSPEEADFSMINMTTGVHVGFGSIPLTDPSNTPSLEKPGRVDPRTAGAVNRPGTAAGLQRDLLRGALCRPWPGLPRRRGQRGYGAEHGGERQHGSPPPPSTHQR